MLTADPARLYSWWWNSHISPKNSKWLQENLRDMDAKVKSMIKLIEEDADSFARRAEMYYKKRPELMKLVEEFYRAYRALAERYDHATGELRQAHRTMAEAFPNQIPFNLSEDSPSGAYVADVEPNTPDATFPTQHLFDTDNSQKDFLGKSSLFSVVKRSGGFPEEKDSITNKKGLKQLNEMFLLHPSSDKKTLGSGGRIENAKSDGKMRRGPTFQEDAEKGSEESEPTVLNGMKNKVDVKDKGTQYEAMNLEAEVQENLDKAGSELHNLQMALTKLQEEHEAAIAVNQQTLEQHKNSSKRITDLDTQLSLAHEEVRRLNEEIFKGIVKLKTAEERAVLLDIANKSLQSEMDNLVQKFIMQQEEHARDHKELRQVRLCIQEEHLQSMSRENTLQSLGQLYSQLTEQHRLLVLELQHGMHLLKDREHRNHVLEDEVLRLKEENDRLDTQNMSAAMSIKNFQDELRSLKELIGKLQEDVELRTHERNALQQELYCLKEERNDLDRRYTIIVSQIESLGLDSEYLQASVKDLQDENVIIKESCNRKDEEKEVLCQNLKNMENVFENNKLLEKSLLDKNSDLERLREKFKIVESSCSSLMEDKMALSKEKDALLANLSSMMQIEQLLEAMNAAAQEKHVYLEKEKVLILNRLEELQTCLKLEREEHESIVQPSSSQLDDLERKISSLLEKGENMKAKLEEKDDQILASQIEISVSCCVIVDMCRMTRNLVIKHNKYLDISSNANRLVTELEQKNLEQQIKLESALEKNSLTSEQNLELRSGVKRLVEFLNVDLDHGYFDKVGIEVIVHKIQSRVDAMTAILVTAQNENERMHLEIIITATILEHVGMELSGLLLKKNALEVEIVSQAEKLKDLQNEKHEIEQLSLLLRQKLISLEDREKLLEAEISTVIKQLSDSQELSRSLENENHKLYDENKSFAKDLVNLNGHRHVLEEENSTILSEALSLGNLALVFERFSTEKTLEIKRLSGALTYLDGINVALEEQAQEMIEKLKVLEMENLHFKSSIEKLEEYKKSSMLLQDEVDTFRIESKKLKQQIEIEQKLLNEKVSELSEAGQKLGVMHTKNAEITRELERVKNEACEAVALKEALKKDVMEFTIDVAKKSKEIDHMYKERESLKSDLERSSKKIHKLKCQEDRLKNELKENKYVMELLHTDCTTLCYNLQVSVIHVVVLEQKVYELISVCKNLEEQIRVQMEKFLDAEASKNAEIHELKRTNALLEEENLKMKLESIGYVSFISSLKESTISLEHRCLALTRTKCTSLEDGVSSKFNYQDKVHEPHKDKGGDEPDGLRDLHILQAKIQAIDDSVQIFENIKKEYHETKLTKETLEKELKMLAEEIADRGKEMKSILEGKEKLELECDELLEEIGGSHFQEEYLKSELRSSAEEIELWQTSLEMAYHDLQSCAIYVIMIDQKWHELVEVCQNLEIKSQLHASKVLDHITVRDVEVDELRRKVARLEELNEEMSLRSSESSSFISSIKERVCSLEERCLKALGTQTPGVSEPSDVDSSAQRKITTLVDSKSVLECAGTEKEVLQLQQLLCKLKTVEKLVIDLAQLINRNNGRDYFDARSKETDFHAREDVTVRLKDGKSGDSSEQNSMETHKAKNVLITKDIQLDYVSGSSSVYVSVADSFGKDGRGNAEPDEQMQELWEAAERYCNHEPEIIPSVKSHSQDSNANGKFSSKKVNKNNDHGFSELQAEREVAVDKMEVSSEIDTKKRIREVLVSEAHRLMDLQNNVQGLSKRFEKLRKLVHPNGSEISNEKEKLGKVESVILQLVEANHELLKGGWDSRVSSERSKGKSEVSTIKRFPDKPDAHGPFMQETAKRLEKVEKLELELQRIEFMLRKWEDVELKKNHAEVDQRSERALLKDYFNDGTRNQRRKKQRLCSCMRPTTKSD